MSVLTKINSSVEDSQPIVNKVEAIRHDIFGDSLGNGEIGQFRTQIHPIIANFVYKREQELSNHIKLNTLIEISRVLDNENVIKCFNALGYDFK